jgi:hypothetical protein
MNAAAIGSLAVIALLVLYIAARTSRSPKRKPK